MEARLSVEESSLRRGSWVTYWYGVKQRVKEISGTATRHIYIPSDLSIKGKTNTELETAIMSFVQFCFLDFHINWSQTCLCFIQRCIFMKDSLAVMMKKVFFTKLLTGRTQRVWRFQMPGSPQLQLCWTESSRNGLRQINRALRACVKVWGILKRALVLLTLGWHTQTIHIHLRSRCVQQKDKKIKVEIIYSSFYKPPLIHDLIFRCQSWFQRTCSKS